MNFSNIYRDYLSRIVEKKAGANTPTVSSFLLNLLSGTANNKERAICLRYIGLVAEGSPAQIQDFKSLYNVATWYYRSFNVSIGIDEAEFTKKIKKYLDAIALGNSTSDTRLDRNRKNILTAATKYISDLRTAQTVQASKTATPVNGTPQTATSAPKEVPNKDLSIAARSREIKKLSVVFDDYLTNIINEKGKDNNELKALKKLVDVELESKDGDTESTNFYNLVVTDQDCKTLLYRNFIIYLKKLNKDTEQIGDNGKVLYEFPVTNIEPNEMCNIIKGSERFKTYVNNLEQTGDMFEEPIPKNKQIEKAKKDFEKATDKLQIFWGSTDQKYISVTKDFIKDLCVDYLNEIKRIDENGLDTNAFDYIAGETFHAVFFQREEGAGHMNPYEDTTMFTADVPGSDLNRKTFFTNALSCSEAKKVLPELKAMAAKKAEEEKKQNEELIKTLKTEYNSQRSKYCEVKDGKPRAIPGQATDKILAAIVAIKSLPEYTTAQNKVLFVADCIKADIDGTLFQVDGKDGISNSVIGKDNKIIKALMAITLDTASIGKAIAYSEDLINRDAEREASLGGETDAEKLKRIEDRFESIQKEYKALMKSKGMKELEHSNSLVSASLRTCGSAISGIAFILGGLSAICGFLLPGADLFTPYTAALAKHIRRVGKLATNAGSKLSDKSSKEIIKKKNSRSEGVL